MPFRSVGAALLDTLLLLTAAAAAGESKSSFPYYAKAGLLGMSPRRLCHAWSLGLRGGGDETYGSSDPITQLGKNGHIDQIEYALKAVQKGLTVIALKGEHVSCVLVERRALPPLQEASSVRKIYQIDAHILGTMAGLSADARVLVDRAQVECLNHRLTYEDCPSVRYVARFLGDVALSYTMRGDARPFGCSMILAGFDMLNKAPGSGLEPKPYPVPRIFLVEPSGMYQEWKAVAIGRNSPVIMQYLEKNYKENVKQIEGLDIVKEERFLCEFALTTLMEVSKVTSASVEIATQTADGGTRILLDDEVQLLLDNLEMQAKTEQDAAIAAGLISAAEAEDIGLFNVRKQVVKQSSSDSLSA